MSEKSNLNDYFSPKYDSNLDSFTSLQITNSAASFFDQISLNSSANKDNILNDDSSVNVSDIAEARRRDAWIPKQETQKILVALATTKAGSMYADRDHLTMPGTMIDETFNDPVSDIVSQLDKPENVRRQILTADDVTQDERGLRLLIEKYCLRSAINLTERLLKIYGQGFGNVSYPTKHSPHSLQIWFTRLALLVKTQMFSWASQEAEAFKDLDQPDLYYAFYPDLYGCRLGSMVPFSFRLLIAEIGMFDNHFNQSLKNLFQLLCTTNQIINNLENGRYEDGNVSVLAEEDRKQSLSLWQGRKRRVIHSLVNCSFLKKDYSLAIDLIDTYILQDDSVKDLSPYYGVMGRICLELRDLQMAKLYFAKNQTTDKQSPLNIENLINCSHIAICERNYKEAEAFLKQAYQMEPNNLLVINNYAICLLYNCQLSKAVNLLENTVESNLLTALQNEQILVMLAHLYNLQSSTVCTKSKQKLFKLLSKLNCDIPQVVLANFKDLF